LAELLVAKGGVCRFLGEIVSLALGPEMDDADAATEMIAR
jgi:hypothetical protein